MAPHAGFSLHMQSQRPPSPQENTSMETVPEGASGVVSRRDQMLNPSPLLPNSDWLPMELTMPEYLRSVTGVDDLHQLKNLKLRVIAREASIQRIGIYAPGLIHLDLQGSSLSSLRDLGCNLVLLEVLSVSRCGLNSLDGTYGFPVLRDLIASYNRIKDVAPCSAIENLRFLDVRGNLISNMGCMGFLSVCPKLEELVLSECPLASQQHYRRNILRILPDLLVLDSLPTGEGGYSSSSADEDSELDGEATPANEAGAQPSPTSASFTAKGNVPSTSGEKSSEVTGDEEGRRGVGGGRMAKRPASAAARLQVTKGGGDRATVTGARKKRPQTARPWRPLNGTLEESHPEPISFALSDEAPSSLTSGVTLCGNIAAALLRNRSLADARDKRGHVVGVMKTSGASRRVSEATGNSTPSSAPDDCRGDVLEASRRWREAYSRFREMNREKWAKEDEEEEDDDVEEQANVSTDEKFNDQNITSNTKFARSHLRRSPDALFDKSFNLDPSASVD